MAERRMFAKTIIDSDAFLEMPVTSRLLYYDLAMRADDDGFNNSPKKIMKIIGATEDDLRILIARKFIIPFENGVVVIKHWRIHNYIRKDTYKETQYKEEKELLEYDENNAYRLVNNLASIPDSTNRLRAVDEPSTQDRLGKDRIGKDSLGEDSIGEDTSPAHPKEPKHKYGEYQHVLLTDTDRERLVNDYGEDETHEAIKYLDEYIETSGKKYKNHYLVMRKWVFDAVKEHKKKPSTGGTLLDAMKDW